MFEIATEIFSVFFWEYREELLLVFQALCCFKKNGTRENVEYKSILLQMWVFHSSEQICEVTYEENPKCEQSAQNAMRNL